MATPFNPFSGTGAVTSKFVSYAKEYERDCIRATLQGIRKAAQVVAARARQNAPRAENHRTSRTYPGGRKYTGEPPIYRSIRSRAKVSRSGIQVFGWVKAIVGYSVFVEYGTKFNKSVNFMRRALAEKAADVERILAGEWPK